MPARIIDGKKIAHEIKQAVKRDAAKLKAEKGVVPGLGFILVGENPSSQVYVRMKGKACEELGFYSVTEEMPKDILESVLLEKIEAWNNEPKIHGILVQLPLPKQINEETIVQSVDPRKDVD